MSKELGEKVIRNGYAIDSVYRNENEVSMQMSIMTVLILELSSGLRGASKLFIKLYSGHIREVGSAYEKRAVTFSILNLLEERRLQF